MSAFVVAGLVLGSVYAISALGLVLTYVSSGVFNFAQGGIALFVAWTFYDLDTRRGWDVLPAALVAIGLVAPLIGLVMWAILFRRLAGAPLHVQLVATIGLFVAIPPLVLLVFGDEPAFSPSGLAGRTPALYDILGITVNQNQVIVCVAAAASALLFVLLLRFTTLGLKQRAVVDAQELAGLTGINANVVSASSWVLGSAMAGFAGVLVIPFFGLDPAAFTQLIIASFAAVVIGRFRSMTWAFGGALAIGVAQGLSVKYVDATSNLAVGVKTSIPFLVMVGALLVLQVRGATASAASERHVLPAHPVPLPLRRAGLVAVAVAALVVPFLVAPIWVGLMGGGVAVGLVFLSYVLATGEGGMISLAQVSFAGMGAIFTAQLTTVYSWPLVPAILVTSAGAAVVAALIASPLVRLGGLYLALATLGFALLIDNLVFRLDRFWQLGSGVVVSRPALGSLEFRSDRAFYFLVLAVFVVVALAVMALQRSTLGAALSAVRSSATGSESIGIDPVRLRFLTFVSSAFVASLGGAMYALYLGRARPDGFSALDGLVWLAILVTWGARSVPGAFVAGVMVTVFPQLFAVYISDGLGDIPVLLFGLGAIALAQEPRGIVAQFAGAAAMLTRRPGTFVERPREAPA